MLTLLADHLWQSTLFAGAAALVALLLRGHRAEVRYRIWLAASIKFLVPFAPLIALGARAGWTSAPLSREPVWAALDVMTTPFADASAGIATPATPLVTAAASPLPLATIVLVAWSWPRGISARLEPAQVEAVLTHELAHVRRHDNLAAAIHMLIEALFWFHPAVWLIGARLVAEREHACDDAVLRLGSDPEGYAESIVRTCRFYLESPLQCVSGVTGADLKKRIATIMHNRPGRDLGWWTARALVITAAATVAAPIALGVFSSPRLLAQTAEVGSASFDAISIKPNLSGGLGIRLETPPGHYSSTNVTVRMMIRDAFHVGNSQIVGGPRWASGDFLTADHWDIEATMPETATAEEVMQRLRRLLTDRFKLVTHVETRTVQVYALVPATRSGARGSDLKAANDPRCQAPGAREDAALPADGGKPGRGDVDRGRPPCGALFFTAGNFVGRSSSVEQLTGALSNLRLSGLDRIVIDRTGMAGAYDFTLRWGGPLPGPSESERTIDA